MADTTAYEELLRRHSRPPAKRRAMPTYANSLWGAWRHPPALWKWPAVWALFAGALIQVGAGLFATLLSLLLLVAADASRCPVAVGAESMRPFYSWLVGVGIGVSFCEWMTVATRSASQSWVLWGVPAAYVQTMRYFGYRM